VGNADPSRRAMVIRTADGVSQIIEGAMPVAVNNHTRPPVAGQPGASPAPTPSRVPVPQILGWEGSSVGGHDGTALVLWERQPDGETWFPFGLEEMIPNMDGWETISNVTDMNDDGVIVGSGSFKDPSNPAAQPENHGFMLVPIGFQAREGEINHGFDPRVTQDDPWPWASVVKGALSNAVKVMLPGNAAQMKLVVVPEGSEGATIDVTPKDGFKNGDNNITLSSSADGDSITTATVEVHMFNEQGSDTGEVVAKLHVMALPHRTVSLGIYRVEDPSSSNQEVGGPTNAQIKELLDSIYQQAGVEFQIVSSDSGPLSISYDIYQSPRVAAGDGRVQEEEFATIAGDSRTQSGQARLFLAANSGVANDDDLPLEQRTYARGLTPPGETFGFVFTKTGHNNSLIAQLNSGA
jgi:hypothetical protein